MAKTRTRKTSNGVNKSEKIRTFIAANKKAKGPAIVAGLAEQGLTVSLPLVYAQLAKAGGRRRKTTRGANTTRGSKTSTSGGISLETLLAAKKLASKMGGVERAREALEVLAKLS